LAILGIEKSVFCIEFDCFRRANGSFITAFYLGIIGMVIAYVTKQKTVGHIVPFSYYMLDMFTMGKYTKEFYLFSLLNDNFNVKLNLLISSIVILVWFLIYLYRKL
jgi:hypothetical protein